MTIYFSHEWAEFEHRCSLKGHSMIPKTKRKQVFKEELEGGNDAGLNLVRGCFKSFKEADPVGHHDFLVNKFHSSP